MNKKWVYFIIAVIFGALKACAFVNDEFAEQTLSNKELARPQANLDYNYLSFEKIPIHLKINNNLSTRRNTVYEGQKLEFTVKRDVKYNKQKIIRKGTAVTAQIETYVTRGMNGVPAMLIIDNFNIPGIDKNKLKGPFIKKGASLTLLVLPVKWALTPIPGVGSLTNFIIGGNASLTDKDRIVIYYYPDWNKKL